MKFRRYIVLLILFNLTYQCFASLSLLAWFGANQTFIAQNLCENRFNPELHCNGQCVLMKKMKLIKDKQEKQQFAERFVQIPFIIVPLFEATLFMKIDDSDGLSAFSYVNMYSFLFLQQLRQPPKISVS